MLRRRLGVAEVARPRPAQPAEVPWSRRQAVRPAPHPI